MVSPKPDTPDAIVDYLETKFEKDNKNVAVQRNIKDRPSKLNTRLKHLTLMQAHAEVNTLIEMISRIAPWYIGRGEKVQAVYLPEQLTIEIIDPLTGGKDYMVVPANYYLVVGNTLAEPIPATEFIQKFRFYDPVSGQSARE